MASEELNAVVGQRIEVNPGLVKLRVIPLGWELPDFTPGQYGVLGLPGSAPRYHLADPEENPPENGKLIKRAYSVASSSVAKEFIEFYISIVRSGALTPRLLNLKVNDRIWLSPKFKGMFTMSEVPTEFSVALFATGTGVAPYMSMIRTEIENGMRRRFAVVHGAYHLTDLGYHEELSTLASISPSFSYIPVLSHAHEEPTPWKGHRGFVQKIWQEKILEKAWGFQPTPDNTHLFLCGHPMMIAEMTEILEAEGFTQHSKKEPGQIHIEKYFT